MLKRFIRPFITTPISLYAIPKKNKLPPRPLWLVKEDEIEEKFIKSGGPGGQKVNKVNTKVEIRHIPTNIVVSCQESRLQERNRIKARELLALRLDDLYNPGNSRNAVLKERAQKVKQSKSKKSNRKYKLLDEESRLKKQKELEDEQNLMKELDINVNADEFDDFIKNAKMDLK
ncbi:uncharacterized protein KGF55_000711 [Candida pseudojiufengensis]|uniref:uncharacterized protein n=1 Tax=Candida pseudojiufengensis TaxID=497109 RepID=UPI0022251FE7|nr:uncharacterized protein KGF55_000711 [Candida pseudojiufengensis]KAI5966402.1 hypothetical protein KGF55_000711 [Candida pseudojiufengensis]